MKALVPVEIIEGKILLIRGQKVMLDRDLAQLGCRNTCLKSGQCAEILTVFLRISCSPDPRGNHEDITNCETPTNWISQG